MSGGFNGWHQANPFMTPSEKPKTPPVGINIPAPTVDSVPRKAPKSPFPKTPDKK